MVIANNASDLFGALLVVGVMGHIAIQVILNIAVVTNTIPNTGISLPFISYGGSSVMFLIVEIGLVLSVAKRNPAEVRMIPGRGSGSRMARAEAEGQDRAAAVRHLRSRPA